MKLSAVRRRLAEEGLLLHAFTGQDNLVFKGAEDGPNGEPPLRATAQWQGPVADVIVDAEGVSIETPNSNGGYSVYQYAASSYGDALSVARQLQTPLTLDQLQRLGFSRQKYADSRRSVP